MHRRSRANLMAIRNVLWAYTIDHQNQVPEFAADWQQRLQASPYILDEAFFHSPRATPGTASYFYVVAANGGIPGIVLLENNELNPDRGAWAVDLNGIVRWLPRAEYEEIQSAPGWLFVPSHEKPAR